MRIAIVHPYPWPEVRRGAERYLDDLAHYLAPRGHRVEIVTGTRGASRTEELDDGVIVHRLKHLRAGPAYRLGIGEVETFGARATARLLRSRPQVVHAFTPSGALAGRAARLPTLYTVLGHPDRAQLPVSRTLRNLFTAAIRTATVTAVLSKASASALLESLGRRAVVLPPGVRLERFPPDLSPRTGTPRLLFSASLADRRKRVDLAVKSLAVVLESHPDIRLRLSGEGDESWALAVASAAGEHVRAAVDVLGPGAPADVPARYREASVTILPAEHEAFGLAIVESLACGTPAVCTPAGGGMAEIIGSDGVGAVAHSASPVAMAEAIQNAIRVAGEEQTPTRCVERARCWSWEETVGPAHERLYAQMAQRVPEPDAGFLPDVASKPA